MASTSSPQPITLHHVGLVVPDMSAAVEFFTAHLDATVEFSLEPFIDPSGAAVQRLGAKPGASFALTMLRLGAGRVELLQWWPCLGDSVPSAPNVTGAAHLAVSVSDISEALDKLTAVDGVTILSTPLTFTEGPTPGLSNAFVTTPWGLLIELMAWPEEQGQ